MLLNSSKSTTLRIISTLWFLDIIALVFSRKQSEERRKHLTLTSSGKMISSMSEQIVTFYWTILLIPAPNQTDPIRWGNNARLGKNFDYLYQGSNSINLFGQYFFLKCSTNLWVFYSSVGDASICIECLDLFFALYPLFPLFMMTGSDCFLDLRRSSEWGTFSSFDSESFLASPSFFSKSLVYLFYFSFYSINNCSLFSASASWFSSTFI